VTGRLPDPDHESLDKAIQQIAGSAQPDDEALRAWQRAFNERVTLPCDGFVILALKTRRSLVAAHRAARGRPCGEDDARGSAKIALISIDRSREALRTLARGRVRGLARYLVVMLDVLAVGLEARVPGARCFVRPGLDDRM